MNDKQVVLLSGCSSGIGLGLAKEFASRGLRVIATARNLSTIASLKSNSIDVKTLDVTSQKSIDACVAQVIGTEGKIDILINNAGFLLIGPIIEMPLDDLRLAFETNLIGLVALSQAVAPHMIKRKSGRIVNLGSISGIFPTPFAGAYCSTKAAVNAISDSMRMELAPFCIDVVNVEPGAIKSELGSNAAKTIDRFSKSRYASIFDHIKQRAYSSQEYPTSVEEFSKKLVDKLSKKKVKEIIRIGKESFRLPLFKKCPESLIDKVLTKKFGLDKLRP